jgi:mercuric ion transport protein
VLVSLGVTGAWIGSLSALYTYKWIFFLVTAALLGGGFYRVYRTPKEAACLADGSCAAPISDRITKGALWLASSLALTALVFPYITPMLLD